MSCACPPPLQLLLALSRGLPFPGLRDGLHQLFEALKEQPTITHERCVYTLYTVRD
jgi:hypothetical protein